MYRRSLHFMMYSFLDVRGITCSVACYARPTPFVDSTKSISKPLGGRRPDCRFGHVERPCFGNAEHGARAGGTLTKILVPRVSSWKDSGCPASRISPEESPVAGPSARSAPFPYPTYTVRAPES